MCKQYIIYSCKKEMRVQSEFMMSIVRSSLMCAGVTRQPILDAHTRGQEADGGANAEVFLRCLAAVIFSWRQSSNFLRALLVAAASQLCPGRSLPPLSLKARLLQVFLVVFLWPPEVSVSLRKYP